jgi:hypothetical protein
MSADKKEYNRLYYLANKDKYKEDKRKYYLANKDKIKEQQRIYYLKNKEKLLKRKKVYKKEYRLANKDKIKERNRLYYLANKDKIKKKKKLYQKKYRQTKTGKKVYRINQWKANGIKDQYNDKYETIYKIYSVQKMCSICFKLFNNKNRMDYKCIDHCHKTGKMRRICCCNCNLNVVK